MGERQGARKTRRGEDREEYRAFATVLREVREEAELSQKALSLELGKPSNFMWRIESGRTLTDIATIWDIAAITGVEVTEIIARAIAEIKRNQRKR